MDEDKMLKLLNNADPEAVARAMQNTTMQDMADSAARSLALEQLDENKKQIKLKIKPKKERSKSSTTTFRTSRLQNVRTLFEIYQKRG